MRPGYKISVLSTSVNACLFSLYPSHPVLKMTILWNASIFFPGLVNYGELAQPAWNLSPFDPVQILDQRHYKYTLRDAMKLVVTYSDPRALDLIRAKVSLLAHDSQILRPSLIHISPLQVDQPNLCLDSSSSGSPVRALCGGTAKRKWPKRMIEGELKWVRKWVSTPQTKRKTASTHHSRHAKSSVSMRYL